MALSWRLSVLAAFAVHVVVGIPRLPNIVGHGYNLIRGNPRSNLQDPGLGNLNPIFAFTYAEQQTTPDGNFLIPDDTSVSAPGMACSYDTGSSSFNGAYSYQQTLQTDVSISASATDFMFSAAFSASAEYHSTSTAAFQRSMHFTHAMATCQIYVHSMETYLMYPLSKSFVLAVQSLDNLTYAEAPEVYQKFITAFGTHYIYSADLGGRFVMESWFSSDSWQTMQQNGYDIEENAKLSLEIFSGSFSGNINQQQQVQQEFDDMRSQTNELCVGAWVDTQNGGLPQWTAALQKTPAFIGGPDFTLVGIEQLLTASYFPGDPQIAFKQTFLIQALQNLCGNTPGCVAASSDPLPQNFASSSAFDQNAAIIFNGSPYVFGGFDPNGYQAPYGLASKWSSGQWVTLAPMPTPVQGAAWVVPTNGSVQVWCIGGNTSDSPVDLVQIYDTDLDAWYFGPQLPAPDAFSTAGAVFLDGTIHLVDDDMDYLTFDTTNATAQWVEHQAVPCAIDGVMHAIFAIPPGIGMLFRDVNNTAWLGLFNPATWQCTMVKQEFSNIPAWPMAYVDEVGRLWLLGGYSPTVITSTTQVAGKAAGKTFPYPSNQVFVMPAGSNQLEQTDPLSLTLAHSAVLQAGSAGMYLIGGEVMSAGYLFPTFRITPYMFP